MITYGWLQIGHVKDGQVFEEPWCQAWESGLGVESSEELWSAQVDTFPLNEQCRL